MWNGEKFHPEGEPYIWSAFPQNKHVIQYPKFESTADRGYTAEWEVREDTLFLTSLEGRIDGKQVGLTDVFPDKKAPISATWFSGSIILPLGKVIGLHKDLGRHIYTKETHLTMEKGKLVKKEEKTFDPEKTPVWKIH